MKPKMRKTNPSMFNQYIATALWSSTGDGETPLDAGYSESDLSDDAAKRAHDDLDAFVDKAGSLLDGLDLTDVAHDFWLTRNSHGAGFWDGDYPDALGEKLTALAHSFGELAMYAGSDNKLYFA